MDQKRAVIIVGLVALLIILLIGGVIYYLTRVFSSNNAQTGGRIVTSSSTPLPQTAGPTPTSTPANFKTYTGKGFLLQYPKTWGLLTCSNSQNIEFDPVNSTDQLNVRCDRALKPVTVLVNHPCSIGTAQTLGNISVTKSVESTPTGVDYEWCTKTGVPLDVTHRVSSDGSRATSTGDFSSQVEQMIQSYSFGGS